MNRKETLERLESCRKAIVRKLRNVGRHTWRYGRPTGRHNYNYVNRDVNTDRFYRVTQQDGEGTVEFRTKYRKYTETKPTVDYAVNPLYKSFRGKPADYNRPSSPQGRKCVGKFEENFRVIKPVWPVSNLSSTSSRSSPNGFKRKQTSEDRHVKRFKCPDGPRTPPLSYRRSRSPETSLMQPTCSKKEMLPVSLSYGDHKRHKQAQIAEVEKDWCYQRSHESHSHSPMVPFIVNEPDSFFCDITKKGIDKSLSTSYTSSSKLSTNSSLDSGLSCNLSTFVSSEVSSPGLPYKETDAPKIQPAREVRRLQKNLERNKRKEILRQEIRSFVNAGVDYGDDEIISKLLKLNFKIPRSSQQAKSSDPYDKYIRKKKVVVNDTDEREKHHFMPPPPPQRPPPTPTKGKSSRLSK